MITPYLLKLPNEEYVYNFLKDEFFEKAGIDGWTRYYDFDDQSFQTISIQLRARGSINTERRQTFPGEIEIFWSLIIRLTKKTNFGSKAVKSKKTVN